MRFELLHQHVYKVCNSSETNAVEFFTLPILRRTVTSIQEFYGMMQRFQAQQSVMCFVKKKKKRDTVVQDVGSDVGSVVASHQDLNQSSVCVGFP